MSLASTTAAPDADISAPDATVRALLRAHAAPSKALVLAVSGGCDSMVLLHAVARALVDSNDGGGAAAPRVRVATFDHGTGPHAIAAARLVEAEGARLGLEVSARRAERPGSTEAEWRAARWAFLRAVSGPDGVVVTAHSRDDQLETVVMRAMRGAGARGLAGLRAAGTRVARPFLDVPRSTLRQYAVDRAIPFVDDPSNASRRHLRNRVRLDLLPGIARVRPTFGADMLALAERAAEWRSRVDVIAARFVTEDLGDGSIRVAREELATYDSQALCILWPAIAARAHVTLDRRGTVRLAEFTTSGAPGARIQLSGSVEVYRHRESFIVRRRPELGHFGGEVPLVGVVEFGEWRFRPVQVSNTTFARDSEPDPSRGLDDASGRIEPCDDLWTSDLPSDTPLWIREWRPADRMRVHWSGSARRVKRFFGDARVPGPSRAGWPVVLADDEIVWIPGVRRMRAAPERSGRPVVRYACERVDGRLPSSW